MSDDHSDAESFHSAHSRDNTDPHHSPTSQHSSTPSSRSTSPHTFADAPSSTPPDPPLEETSDTPLRFPPEEEARLLADSNTHKSTGSTHFSHGAYSLALTSYTLALKTTPTYLPHPLSILHANISACHLKLASPGPAAKSATAALDCLQLLDPVPLATTTTPSDPTTTTTQNPAHGTITEISDETATRLDLLAAQGITHDQIQRLRIKALLRRAAARSSLNTWSDLQGASEDYAQLASMGQHLSALDRAAVEGARRGLPKRLDEAKAKEMGDMVGKLKELGNGILKPFGLSTENFQFVKDEASGGYSMQFNQGKGGGK